MRLFIFVSLVGYWMAGITWGLIKLFTETFPTWHWYDIYFMSYTIIYIIGGILICFSYISIYEIFMVNYKKGK